MLLKHKNLPIEENQIIIADFGLATLPSTEEALILKKCGTPGYMAPEILEQSEEDPNFSVDIESDIFSLGIIFHIVLTGKSPFKGIRNIIDENKRAEIDTS